jgi:flagellar assembly protein FliH
MSSRLITHPETEAIQPMPWIQTTPRPTMSSPIYKEVGKTDKAAEAQAQAEQIRAQLAAAEAKAEVRVREAREAGRREGEAAARQAAQAEVREVTNRLAASIQQLAELRPRLRLQAESDLVRLAVSIARRIVFRELSVDPETVTALARVALDKLRMQEVTKARVHPEHKAPVQEFLNKNGAGHIEITADQTLARGSILFETTRGNLDVSAETQLREIERGLTDRLRGQLQ